MSVQLTVDQLRRLTDDVVAEGLPPSTRIELRGGYDGSMKEHDRCVKVLFDGTDIEITKVRRYG